MAIPFLVDVIVLVAFLIVGTIIIMLLKAAIFFLPAIVLALVVWWLTGSLAYAGVAFVIIAVLTLLKKK